MTSEMKVFNTYSREKEVFSPLHDDKVNLYSCGPTVYNYAHIGNLRAFVFADILKRTLEVSGYDVTHVMNITDVGHLTSDADEGEDKVEKHARESGTSAWDLVKYYTDQFHDDMRALSIAPPSVEPKATEHIEEQINLVKKLEEMGYTYTIDDGVYFDTNKFDGYGKMANLDKQDLQAGARVEMAEGKRNITDFALWKFSPKDEKRQMEWDSPWGKGFPGWHIECSAMSMKYLGETIDIHTGGEDHIPIHHTNEIAQSEAATGKQFVKYWLHSAFLKVDGEKMSKSLGNFYRLNDIVEKGYDPLAYRYLLLTAQYRTTLNFTWDSLDAAQKALTSVRRKVSSLPDGGSVIESLYGEFLSHMADDLNTPQALATLHLTLKSNHSPADIKASIQKMDEVFALDLGRAEEDAQIPAELLELLDQRNRHRANKEWDKADAIRDKLDAEGYVIEDSDNGSRLVKK